MSALHLLLGSFLDPFVAFLWWIVEHLNDFVHNLGVTLILLAAAIRAVFWGLNVKQFKAMLSMQRIAPRLKQIQERYKGDQQRIQQETMALYRDAGVNPLAGCLPMIVQLPILYSVYWVVLLNKTCAASPPFWHSPQDFFKFPMHTALHFLCFNDQQFLWIGSGLAAHAPTLFGRTILGQNLAGSDLVLIVLYAASMYFSVRYGSAPSTDPQQAQMQRMMSIISPLMIGYFAWNYQWPSAMVLYWLSYNVFTMAQQIYMLRRYHQPLSTLDSAHALTEQPPVPPPAAIGSGAAKNATAVPKDAAADDGSQETPGSAAPATRRRRRKKKRKR